MRDFFLVCACSLESRQPPDGLTFIHSSPVPFPCCPAVCPSTSSRNLHHRPASASSGAEGVLTRSARPAQVNLPVPSASTLWVSTRSTSPAACADPLDLHPSHEGSTGGCRRPPVSTTTHILFLYGSSLSFYPIFSSRSESFSLCLNLSTDNNSSSPKKNLGGSCPCWYTMNPASRRHYDSLVARYGDQDALADRFGGQNDGPDAWWSNLRVRMSQDHLLRHEARRRAATLEAFEDRENSHDGAFGCGDRASAKAMVTLHQPNLGETREQDCAVCLEPFEEGNTLRMMPCFHSFHQRCIFSWLRISRICPVCRFTLPSQADFESEKAEKERVSASPEDGNNWLMKINLLSELLCLCPVSQLSWSYLCFMVDIFII